MQWARLSSEPVSEQLITDSVANAAYLLGDNFKWTGFLLEQNSPGFHVSEKKTVRS